jgi:hypothetical protein
VTTGLNYVADQVDQIISSQAFSGNLPSIAALKTANHDSLESTNNILKQLVIKAEKGGLVSEGQREYRAAFGEHYLEASRVSGRLDAETAAKFAGRVIMAKSTLDNLGQYLAVKFPKTFGWFAKTNPPEQFSGTTIDMQSKPNS